MKHLILFDLHYQHNNFLSRKKLETITGLEETFDSIVLGGDNAELSSGLQNHRVLFNELKTKFECPIGFIVGNHELWGKIGKVSSWELIDEIFPNLGREYGLIYLEQENLNIGDISFIGTYGHFDYSFLRQNKGVSIEDLLKGKFVAEDKKCTWQDKLHQDWEGKGDENVCRELINLFDERIKNPIGDSISVSHTIPRLSLNGWPDSPIQYFLEAYSGSNLLGNILETNGGEYHFCGHTHVKARAKLGKTNVINVGSDYNILRYAILHRDGEKNCVEEREVIL